MMTVTLPYPPSSLSPSPWSKDEDDRLRTLHGSMTIQQIAESLGRSMPSVRARVTRLGLAKKTLWAAEDEAKLIEAYCAAGDSGVLNLDEISKSLGRLKSNVCRKARMLGLTTNQCRKKVEQRQDRRKFKGDKEALRRFQREQKWANKPHPRGMAGKKHTEETKRAIGLRSRDNWIFMSEDKKNDMIVKQLKTREKNGGGSPKFQRGTWKAGWRDIGGKKNYYRSRWEANYARYLEWLKERGEIADWQYEPETFWFDAIKRGVRSYKPDFRVTENNGASNLHEVKGWMCSRSKTTLKRMAKYHPHERIVLIDGRQYRAIRAKVMPLISCWEDSDRDSRE